MTTYARDLRRLLREHGWQFHRQGRGDYEIWIDPATQAKVTLDGKIRSRHLANKILEDSNIGKTL